MSRSSSVYPQSPSWHSYCRMKKGMCTIRRPGLRQALWVFAICAGVRAGGWRVQTRRGIKRESGNIND